MQIDTYFGFFAHSVMMAMGTTITSLTAEAVNLERVALSTTNTFKLHSSEVATVLIPALAEPGELPFVFALSEHDVAGLVKVAGERISLQKLMEQAVGSAVEPFNFMAKRRNRLRGVQFSKNVTGLTAHHLNGQVRYTMATGHFSVPKGRGFAIRLLVTARGRDLIEERATQKSTQRALFSINEGAYLCRPQWEPPPPPPGLDRGGEVSETMLSAWLQTFFGLNDGLMPNRLFNRPVGLMSQVVAMEAFTALAEKGAPTVARLQINDVKALELLVVLPPQAADSLGNLSKSGQERFLGDLFRALFQDSAKLWERFGETPWTWRLLWVGKIPKDSMDAVTKRLEGGGLVLRQMARTEEGSLDWLLGVPPHTWAWLLRLTARAMMMPDNEAPNRQTVFKATGWSQHSLPWKRLLGQVKERGLQDLMRVLQQVRIGEPALAAVAAGLDDALRARWLEAMPVMLRERTQRYELAEGEAERHLTALTRALIPLNRAGKLPQGRLTDWISVYTEFFFSFRQHLLEKLLPPRHLIYGMDRGSLSRLMFDVKNDLLVDALCWAEFPVVDQVRRAITPGFAVRLLEDIAVRRPKLSAFGAQEAQVGLYRAARQGVIQGRYLMRATPSGRLNELFRLMGEE